MRMITALTLVILILFITVVSMRLYYRNLMDQNNTGKSLINVPSKQSQRWSDSVLVKFSKRYETLRDDEV